MDAHYHGPTYVIGHPSQCPVCNPPEPVADVPVTPIRRPRAKIVTTPEAA